VTKKIGRRPKLIKLEMKKEGSQEIQRIIGEYFKPYILINWKI
jgi:hypothetical protein